MDNRLIFLHPYICDVVTEKANHTGYWIPDQAYSVCIGKSVHFKGKT